MILLLQPHAEARANERCASGADYCYREEILQVAQSVKSIQNSLRAKARFY
jgi:hypothetical protein